MENKSWQLKINRLYYLSVSFIMIILIFLLEDLFSPTIEQNCGGSAILSMMILALASLPMFVLTRQFYQLNDFSQKNYFYRFLAYLPFLICLAVALIIFVVPFLELMFQALLGL